MKQGEEGSNWTFIFLVLVWEGFKSLARSFFAVFTGKSAIAVSPNFGHNTTSPLPEKTGRAADRNLDTQNDPASHRRWGTLFVFIAFIFAVVGGVGFLLAYWSDSANWVLGGTLAIFLGGFGVALVLSAHWLMPHKEATEEREKLPSPPDERQGVFEEFYSGEVQRRSMLRWMVSVVAGIFAAGVISLFRSLGKSPVPSLLNTVWTRGQRLVTSEGKPVSVNSLDLGSSITVFPEDSVGAENAQTVLIRVNEHYLQLPWGRSNWAPMGYVAYSRVCTHAGCPVGLFEADTDLLLCPCHQSTFDVLRAACPTSGPAARPLPQLPLYADADGYLRAGGGFSEPPGPGFWGMP